MLKSGVSNGDSSKLHVVHVICYVMIMLNVRVITRTISPKSVEIEMNFYILGTTDSVFVLTIPALLKHHGGLEKTSIPQF